MNRRGFLGAMLAAGAAPAIVKASNLMPIFARKEAGGLLIPIAVEEAGAGSLLTISQITKEALIILENQLTFQHSIHRSFASRFQ